MAETDTQLDALARAHPDALKQFSETLIGALGEIEVLNSRTGLVMLPFRDTAQGTVFHLGEVLVSEAHIRAGEHDGYGMRQGYDLEAAMAMALVDLAMKSDVQTEACTRFCAEETLAQNEADRQTLRRVEATRVNMEAF